MLFTSPFSATAACRRAPIPFENDGGALDSIPEDRAFDRRLSQFDVLLSDIRHPPVIESVDAAAYSGQAGQLISIIARDDFAVAHVEVRIERPDGSPVEVGAAVAQPTSLRWLYYTQLSNPGYADHVLHVLVSDRPGNVTEAVQVLT